VIYQSFSLFYATYRNGRDRRDRSRERERERDRCDGDLHDRRRSAVENTPAKGKETAGAEEDEKKLAIKRRRLEEEDAYSELYPMGSGMVFAGGDSDDEGEDFSKMDMVGDSTIISNQYSSPSTHLRVTRRGRSRASSRSTKDPVKPPPKPSTGRSPKTIEKHGGVQLRRRRRKRRSWIESWTRSTRCSTTGRKAVVNQLDTRHTIFLPILL